MFQIDGHEKVGNPALSLGLDSDEDGYRGITLKPGEAMTLSLILQALGATGGTAQLASVLKEMSPFLLAQTRLDLFTEPPF